MKQIAAKAASGPSGILMYHPTRAFTFGKWMGIEFGTELLEAILVVFLLAQTHIASFAGRVGFVFVAGILAAMATNVSLWNWYGFPSVYIGSYMLIQIVGFLCVGIVAALVLRRASLSLFFRRALRGSHAVLLPTVNKRGRFRQAGANFPQIKSKMIAPMIDRINPAG